MAITAQEKIADNLVAGVKAIVDADAAAGSFPFAAFGPRLTDGMPKSRIELRAGQFIRASDQMAQNPNGAWYYAHRRGFLSGTVVSQRHTLTNQGDDSTHADAVGRFRYLMSIVTQQLVPENVSNYQIVDVIDQGDSYAFDEKTQTDRTDIRFQIDLWLNPSQYAAV